MCEFSRKEAAMVLYITVAVVAYSELLLFNALVYWLVRESVNQKWLTN